MIKRLWLRLVRRWAMRRDALDVQRRLRSIERVLSSIVEDAAFAEIQLKELEGKLRLVTEENERYKLENAKVRSENDVIKTVVLPEMNMAHEHSQARWKAAIAGYVKEEQRALS